MSKRIASVFFVFCCLLMAGCSAAVKSAFVFHTTAYSPQLKEIPVYAETVPLADVKLTEDNRDWIGSAFAKYDEIFEESCPSFMTLTKLTSSDTVFNAEWYDSFQTEATSLLAKCSNFLKIEAPEDMQDMKALADIQVIELYNAIELMKAAASNGNDSDFVAATDQARGALYEYLKPYDYLCSLYDRYEFKLVFSSMKLTSGGKRMFVRFKNNEDVTITEFTFFVECRDKNGEAVEYEGAFEQMQCDWTKANLKSGKVTASKWYWKMNGFKDGYEYRVMPYCYTTSDGRVVVCHPDEFQWSEWKH